MKKVSKRCEILIAFFKSDVLYEYISFLEIDNTGGNIKRFHSFLDKKVTDKKKSIWCHAKIPDSDTVQLDSNSSHCKSTAFQINLNYKIDFSSFHSVCEFKGDAVKSHGV